MITTARQASPYPATLRRAVVSDLASIIDLRIDFERITRDSGSLDVAHRRVEIEALLGPDLSTGKLLCWLAETGGRVVAQAALCLSDHARTGGSGEILNVYTDPGHRGGGIGAALVGEAIAEARSLGLISIRLQPTMDSRRIYERAGFRRSGGGMVLDLRRMEIEDGLG